MKICFLILILTVGFCNGNLYAYIKTNVFTSDFIVNSILSGLNSRQICAAFATAKNAAAFQFTNENCSIGQYFISNNHSSDEIEIYHKRKSIGTYWRLIPTEVSTDMAYEYCQGQNGKVPEPKTPQEGASYPIDPHIRYVIGMKKYGSKFKWMSTLTELNESELNWAHNHPRTQSCVVLGHNKWRTATCGGTSTGFCEFEAP